MQPTFRDIVAICAPGVGGRRQRGRGIGRRQEIWSKGRGNCETEKELYTLLFGKKKKDKKLEVLIESIVLN